jgi:hypothetical protein
MAKVDFQKMADDRARVLADGQTLRVEGCAKRTGTTRDL